jgi:hypothetical protein
MEPPLKVINHSYGRRSDDSFARLLIHVAAALLCQVGAARVILAIAPASRNANRGSAGALRTTTIGQNGNRPYQKISAHKEQAQAHRIQGNLQRSFHI